MILLAAFADEAALLAAARRMAEFGRIETFTPKPLGEGGSRLNIAVLIAGFGGFLGGLLLQIYATMRSYPFNIGGRPLNSWPAYIPIAFEIGVLCAVTAGVIGFLIANHMPALSGPFDQSALFRRASSDAYVLSVDTDHETARAAIEALYPIAVEIVA